MSTATCPDCHSPVPPGASACPQCGLPFRQGPMPPASRSQRRAQSRPARVTTGAVVGGAVAVIVALYFGASVLSGAGRSYRQMRGSGGERLLQWAYTAEQTYFAAHGEYTSSESQLTDPARPSGAEPQPYQLRVASASDHVLCLEAAPTADAGGRVLSMDEGGSVYGSAGCRGQTASTGPRQVDEGARKTLGEVHQGIDEYRTAHDGKHPVALADMTKRVQAAPAGSGYALALHRADEYGVCVAATPRNPAAGLRSVSMDQDGFIYGNARCSGRASDDPVSSGTASR